MRYLISLAVFVTLVVASIAGAADTGCVNYRDYIHRVSGVELPELGRSSAVAGGYAYVANGVSGIHTAEWDGRADNGTRVSPGVYYYPFRGGDHAQRSRIVLLR